jgi:hypothetical protein
MPRKPVSHVFVPAGDAPGTKGLRRRAATAPAHLAGSLVRTQLNGLVPVANGFVPRGAGFPVPAGVIFA